MKKIIIASCLIIIMIMSIIRYDDLNKNAVVEDVYKYQLGQTIKGGAVSIIVKKMEMYNMSESRNVLPQTIKENEQILMEDEFMVAVVEINIHNTSDTEVEMSLTDFALQSGAWTNCFELEAYQELNDFAGAVIKLKGKEEKKVLLPYFMYDYQWPKKEWKNIKKQKFNLVLMVYPEKHYVEIY